MAERTTALSEKRAHLDFLCESLHMATGLSVFLFETALVNIMLKPTCLKYMLC